MTTAKQDTEEQVDETAADETEDLEEEGDEAGGAESTAPSAQKAYELVKIKRRPGPTGVFDIIVDGLDGKQEYPGIRRKHVFQRADAMAGRKEPHCKASYRFWSWLLSQFPQEPPEMRPLKAFAKKVGFSLRDDGKAVETPERAWELLFGESGISYGREPGGHAANAPEKV